MDKIIRNTFAALKLKCDTPSKRKAYNNLVKAFANITSEDDLVKACIGQAKKVFGDSYDEEVTRNTIEGILKAHKDEGLDVCLGIFVNGLHPKKRDEESSKIFDNETRKSFASLKSQCNTPAKRKAFNKLISCFAKSKANFIKLQDAINQGIISQSELRLIKDKLGMSGILIINIKDIDVPSQKYPRLDDKQRVFVFLGELATSGKIVMLTGANQEPCIAIDKADFTEYFTKGDAKPEDKPTHGRLVAEELVDNYFDGEDGITAEIIEGDKKKDQFIIKLSNVKTEDQKFGIEDLANGYDGDEKDYNITVNSDGNINIEKK